MKALCWQGKNKVGVEEVPQPKILNSHDIIVKVTKTAICGSDLHLLDGYVPTMEKGDIIGHEFMGIITETGRNVTNVNPGDRVVIPFGIACGQCGPCSRGLTSLCDNSNPNEPMARKLNGYSGSGMFGYSHLYGGFSGGQAEYVRVPFGNVGACKIPEGLDDEQVLFLSDILPTGYMAAENCNIKPGDVVAVWGCGPVGQFAIQSAFLLGAERVIAIDRFEERLTLARESSPAETLNYEDHHDLAEVLKEMTGGRGPDACIDAVGMEAHGHSIDAILDQAKQSMKLSFDRANVLRQAIQCCGKGGTLSIPGVYAGFLDKIPFGAAFAKGLTLKMGQTNVHKYMRPLLEIIQNGKLDPSFIITHRMKLEDAPTAYDIFKNKEDSCIKVVLTP